MFHDWIWLTGQRIIRSIGRVACGLTRHHVYSKFFPEGYCSRCGNYQEPTRWHIQPDYPKWYTDHYGAINAENEHLRTGSGSVRDLSMNHHENDSASHHGSYIGNHSENHHDSTSSESSVRDLLQEPKFSSSEVSTRDKPIPTNTSSESSIRDRLSVSDVRDASIRPDISADCSNTNLDTNSKISVRDFQVKRGNK
jgi:hypothetical protein